MRSIQQLKGIIKGRCSPYFTFTYLRKRSQDDLNYKKLFRNSKLFSSNKLQPIFQEMPETHSAQSQNEHQWLSQYSVQDLSRSLVREYLYQKNMFKTLNIFEKESIEIDANDTKQKYTLKTISKLKLIKMLCMNNLVVGNRALGQEFKVKTLLEVLVKYLRGNFEKRLKSSTQSNTHNNSHIKDFSMNGDGSQSRNQMPVKISQNIVKVEDFNEKTTLQQGKSKQMGNGMNQSSKPLNNKISKGDNSRPSTAKAALNNKEKDHNNVQKLYSKLSQKEEKKQREQQKVEEMKVTETKQAKQLANNFVDASKKQSTANVKKSSNNNAIGKSSSSNRKLSQKNSNNQKQEQSSTSKNDWKESQKDGEHNETEIKQRIGKETENEKSNQLMAFTSVDNQKQKIEELAQKPETKVEFEKTKQVQIKDIEVDDDYEEDFEVTKVEGLQSQNGNFPQETKADIQEKVVIEEKTIAQNLGHPMKEETQQNPKESKQTVERVQQSPRFQSIPESLKSLGTAQVNSLYGFVLKQSTPPKVKEGGDSEFQDIKVAEKKSEPLKQVQMDKNGAPQQNQYVVTENVRPTRGMRKLLKKDNGSAAANRNVQSYLPSNITTTKVEEKVPEQSADKILDPQMKKQESLQKPKQQITPLVENQKSSALNKQSQPQKKQSSLNIIKQSEPQMPRKKQSPIQTKDQQVESKQTGKPLMKLKKKAKKEQQVQEYTSKFKFDDNFVDQPLHATQQKYQYEPFSFTKMTIKPQLRPKDSKIILQNSINYAQKPNLQSIGNSKKKVEKPLSAEKAQKLKKAVFQKSNSNLPKAWHQGFILSPFKDTPYGLKQIQGGPCGIIAAVQCYFLKHLLYFSKPQSDKDIHDQIRREICLIASLTQILWKVKPTQSSSITLVVPSNKNFSGSKLDFSTLVEVEIDASSFENAFQQIYAYKSSFVGESNHGVTTIIYSIVMTKGIAQIEKQVDMAENPLIGHHGHCTQQLVNLFITGKAASNCFDGKKQISEGFTLHGIDEKSQFGFMTVFETLEYIEVGKHLKNPLFPIWIICKQFHYHVTFANHYLIAQNNDCEKFDLVYFDGLYACENYIRLTFDKVDKDEFGMVKEMGKIDKLPLIEQVLLKKWGRRKADWNGSIRIL